MNWIALKDKKPTRKDFPIWVCKEGEKTPDQLDTMADYDNMTVWWTHWQSVQIPTPLPKPTPQQLDAMACVESWQRQGVDFAETVPTYDYQIGWAAGRAYERTLK